MKNYLCVVALALTPVAAYAQKTTYDYDKTATFAEYKTYALKEGTPVGNELIDQRIITAIETTTTSVKVSSRNGKFLTAPWLPAPAGSWETFTVQVSGSCRWALRLTPLHHD